MSNHIKNIILLFAALFGMQQVGFAQEIRLKDSTSLNNQSGLFPKILAETMDKITVLKIHLTQLFNKK
jgi:hypothetical protein